MQMNFNQNGTAIAVNLTNVYPDDLALFNRFATLYCDCSDEKDTSAEKQNINRDLNNLKKVGNMMRDNSQHEYASTHGKNKHTRLSSNTSNNCFDISHQTTDELKELYPFYKKFAKCLKVAHLNINSIRHKFGPLNATLSKNLLDILFVQETKLDDSFPMNQFHVPGYKHYRLDVKHNTGGIVAYIRDDIVNKRRTDLEINENVFGRIEMMSFQITIEKEDWFFSSVYRQPKGAISNFVSSLETLCENANKEFKNVVLLGDINIDFTKKSHGLSDFCTVYGLKNIVYEPTCVKGDNPSIVDIAAHVAYSTPSSIFNKD